ncbi:hypothetical protein [Cellulosimicrobium sp. 22601]|uniref:hypothetical protein n=1 Tax=unclassified Cellulosimicrobium TaxID=2624466 RepID=UPI003F8732D0
MDANLGLAAVSAAAGVVSVVVTAGAGALTRRGRLAREVQRLSELARVFPHGSERRQLMEGEALHLACVWVVERSMIRRKLTTFLIVTGLSVSFAEVAAWIGFQQGRQISIEDGVAAVKPDTSLVIGLSAVSAIAASVMAMVLMWLVGRWTRPTVAAWARDMATAALSGEPDPYAAVRQTSVSEDVRQLVMTAVRRFPAWVTAQARSASGSDSGER